MNLREAYLYIDENKLQECIQKFDIRVRSIKFMLEEQIVIQVIGLQSFSIDALKNAIKGEIVARYILNEVKLKEEHFYFRIESKDDRLFNVMG